MNDYFVDSNNQIFNPFKKDADSKFYFNKFKHFNEFKIKGSSSNSLLVIEVLL